MLLNKLDWRWLGVAALAMLSLGAAGCAKGGCVSDAECGAGQVCQDPTGNGTCVAAKECNSHSECRSGKCDIAAGKCVAQDEVEFATTGGAVIDPSAKGPGESSSVTPTDAGEPDAGGATGSDAAQPDDKGGGGGDTGATDAGAADVDPGCKKTNGGVEICDGLDNDCNGETDEGARTDKCPPGMAGMNCFTCIDKYEASRPGATDKDPGKGNPAQGAQSVPNVLPWTEVVLKDAEAACAAAKKRLCTLNEWRDACDGAQGISDKDRPYPYGKDYDETACNGVSNVPKPTGSSPNCKNPDGVFDLSGNVTELVKGASASDIGFIGGAYNSTKKEALMCNSFSPNQNPPARPLIGFRCCVDVQ
ncbi:MAG: hypothetical protein GMKNLPBB_00466 [Myxococcota bacterium]|nr:hypothetical protein [Myxococcota bacterium]